MKFHFEEIDIWCSGFQRLKGGKLLQCDKRDNCPIYFTYDAKWERKAKYPYYAEIHFRNKAEFLKCPYRKSSTVETIEE